jgi:AraC-like DNA-binding protein
LLNIWRLSHGPQKIVVRGGGGGDAQNRIKTGSFLLLLVEEGEAQVELYHGASKLLPGDGLLLTAIEPFVFSTPNTFAGIWVEIPIWWLIDLCKGSVDGARQRLPGDLGTMIILGTTTKLLLENVHADQAMTDLIDLFGDVLYRNLQIASRGAATYEGMIDRINKYIAINHRTEGLSPRAAAKSLGCSISSVHKSCASVGATFGGLLSTMRLSVAAYRLSRGHLAVSQIAFDCGFSSLSHFCHAFKRHYGVTPSSVRKRHRVAAAGGPDGNSTR